MSKCLEEIYVSIVSSYCASKYVILQKKFPLHEFHHFEYRLSRWMFSYICVCVYIHVCSRFSPVETPKYTHVKRISRVYICKISTHPKNGEPYIAYSNLYKFFIIKPTYRIISERMIKFPWPYILPKPE